MKHRWFRALLAVLGIAGALAAGVLTAVVTAQRDPLGTRTEARQLMQFEPQDISAHKD